jgi:hypothetical protein
MSDGRSLSTVGVVAAVAGGGEDMTEHVPADYDAPAIVEIGSLHELTLQDKEFGPSDGFTLMGVPIRNASP